MKKRKILVYCLLFVFLALVAFMANFKDFSLKPLFTKSANTKMSISAGHLYDAETPKPDIKIEKELLGTYFVNTKKGNVEKTFYKISNSDKYGIIDEKGNKISAFVYDEIIDFDAKNGLFKTKANKKTGLLNLKNGAVIPAKYQDIEKTSNEDIVLLRNYKYYGLYDIKNGIRILKPFYQKLVNYDKFNWKIYFGKKVGLLYCKNGKAVIVKPKYDELDPYKKAFITYLGEKVGLIASDRGLVLTEPLYDFIELISDVNSPVQVYRTNVDKRYGVIFYSENDGLTVISPIYDAVEYKGRVNVLSGGYWRILDNKGNVVTR